MRFVSLSAGRESALFVALVGFGALAVLLGEVSLLLSSAVLTACAVVATAALSVSFVAASKRVLRDNIASASPIFLLAFELFVVCALTLLAATNWLRVAAAPTFLFPVRSGETTALGRAGFAIYAVSFFMVQGGFCMTMAPSSFALDAVMIWLKVYTVAFTAVLVPIMTSRIMSVAQDKKKPPMERSLATPSVLTKLGPIVMTMVLVAAGLGATILFWTLSPVAGLVLHAVWGVVVVVWMWELLYRRVWLSLVRTGTALPLRDGDSVLDTVGEWLQPAVVGIVGGAMLVYATTACTLLLEKALDPEREASKMIFEVPLHENGLAAALRMAHYAVSFSAGSSYVRNEPIHVLSALAMVPATLVIMAVRVAVLSTGVAGGLAAAASESSKKASRTAATPP
jgi:hypothetical protein